MRKQFLNLGHGFERSYRQKKEKKIESVFWLGNTYESVVLSTRSWLNNTLDTYLSMQSKPKKEKKYHNSHTKLFIYLFYLFGFRSWKKKCSDEDLNIKCITIVEEYGKCFLN